MTGRRFDRLARVGGRQRPVTHAQLQAAQRLGVTIPMWADVHTADRLLAEAVRRRRGERSEPERDLHGLPKPLGPDGQP
jgi:hypothetical protein